MDWLKERKRRQEERDEIGYYRFKEKMGELTDDEIDKFTAMKEQVKKNIEAWKAKAPERKAAREAKDAARIKRIQERIQKKEARLAAREAKAHEILAKVEAARKG